MNQNKKINFDFLKMYSQNAYLMVQDIDFVEKDNTRIDLSDGIYVNVETYITKDRCNAQYESHLRYIDVQYVLEGSEIISIRPVTDCVVVESYDAERDITFYENDYRCTDYVLSAGDYITIDTQHAHMPCIKIQYNKKVKKAVFKIPVILSN